jgi:penicillin-binding protein 1B
MGERTVREVLKRRSAETLRQLEKMRNRRKRPKRRLGAGRMLLWGIGLLLVAAVSWSGWQAWQAQRAFQAHQWSVPARVYARALELYPGADISRGGLFEEVARLGYQESATLETPGTYTISNGHIRLHTRSFRFWDGEQAAEKFEIRFSGDTVISITDLERNTELVLQRLEPPLVGSLFPKTGEDRILVELESVPQTFVDMLLAVEDRDFYEHFGVDPSAVARAIAVNLEAGEVRQGGSTLTMQLVRNFYLSREQTYWRKLNEAIMALSIDFGFSKEEILESYLNEVYLGQDGQRAIHGIGLGSFFYFQRPLQELRVEEIALLVGMIKGPSYYDPRDYPERAIERRNLVLDVAAEQGVISVETAQRATQRELGVTVDTPQGASFYPAFMEILKQQLRADYDEYELQNSGLQVFSTLDPAVQSIAEQKLTAGLERLERGRGLPARSLEGAVVVTSLDGSEVQAVVGGRNTRFAGFNRAYSSVRPIGSLIKPVVFLSALENSDEYTLITPVSDTLVEVELPDGKLWKPSNFRNEFHGTVPLYQALSGSYNAATVRVGVSAGIQDVIRNLQLLGYGRTPSAYPSLLLGAITMTPFEVAQVYGTLGNGGYRTPLNTIREVLDARGEPLQRFGLDVTESVDAEAAYLVDRALQWVMREGTGRSVQQWTSLRVAGKTGTTNDYRDAWFAGFSGDLAAVVWVGRDDNEPIGLTGASGALPIWADLMATVAREDYRPLKPEGVDETWVIPEAGVLSTPDCSRARQVPFIRGSAPAGSPVCEGAQQRNTVQ